MQALPDELFGIVTALLPTIESFFVNRRVSKKWAANFWNHAGLVWSRIQIYLYQKFSQQIPYAGGLSTPRSWRRLQSRALCLCDVCEHLIARKVVARLLLCHSCDKKNKFPMDDYIGVDVDAPASQASIKSPKLHMPGEMPPQVSNIPVKTRYNIFLQEIPFFSVIKHTSLSHHHRSRLLQIGWELPYHFPQHPRVRLSDLTFLMQQPKPTTQQFFAYLCQRFFYELFDFSGTEYPTEWVPYEFVYHLHLRTDPAQQQPKRKWNKTPLPVPKDMIVQMKNRHKLLSLLYQNTTSKLTYLAWHRYDFVIKHFIRTCSSSLLKVALAKRNAAAASAFLILQLYNTLQNLVPLRPLRQDELQECTSCRHFFGRSCKRTSNFQEKQQERRVWCKHCCYTRTPSALCETHIQT